MKHSKINFTASVAETRSLYADTAQAFQKVFYTDPHPVSQNAAFCEIFLILVSFLQSFKLLKQQVLFS